MKHPALLLLYKAIAQAPQLQHRVDAVLARARCLPVVNMYMPVSYDPVITLGKGTFITGVIDVAGRHSITSDINQEWPPISKEPVIACAPKVLLMMRDNTLQPSRGSPLVEVCCLQLNHAALITSINTSTFRQSH
ncbi:hypothetical protein [Granulicella arctica]|uniref:ABC-type hemin transport system substrate-binding protein n=1 Tax=Granulicella arctica TaxID=940613 RepID=A0A7Y9PHL3_9BACT|nr:hypothetical protein [Granulicella arctica]NYF80048.1 ABC-type hemin transport system substrate-binding protein [Granulicella arctica]